MQAFAHKECLFSYTFQPVGNIYRFQVVAVQKCHISYFNQTVGKRDTSKACTLFECSLIKLCDCIGQRYRYQRQATAEKIISYLSNACGNVNTFKACASPESRIPDFRKFIIKIYCIECTALGESTASEPFNTARQRDRSQR